MDFENNNTNQQEPVEEVTQETVEEVTEYTGCDEELSQEVTDEEYEQMMEEIPEEEAQEVPVKKDGFKEFIADLKDKAVCKILFLFAAVGFIFPFFSEYEKGIVSTFTTGIDTFKPYMFLASVEVDRSWVLIAAFAFAVLGFVLTVALKNEIRNIAGFICSAASAVCMGIFAYMLPSMFGDAVTKFLVDLSAAYSEMYGMAIDLTKDADMFELKALPSTGFWFVTAILAVLMVYFVAQIISDSKKKAVAEMTLTEGEFPEDFDEEIYDEEVAAEIEAALEEAAQATEEAAEEVAKETTEE